MTSLPDSKRGKRSRASSGSTTLTTPDATLDDLSMAEGPGPFEEESIAIDGGGLLTFRCAMQEAGASAGEWVILRVSLTRPPLPPRRYRGIDRTLAVGSPAWKREKRLADNRASAARSRVLARARSSVALTRLEELEEDNASLRSELARSHTSIALLQQRILQLGGDSSDAGSLGEERGSRGAAGARGVAASAPLHAELGGGVHAQGRVASLSAVPHSASPSHGSSAAGVAAGGSAAAGASLLGGGGGWRPLPSTRQTLVLAAALSPGAPITLRAHGSDEEGGDFGVHALAEAAALYVEEGSVGAGACASEGSVSAGACASEGFMDASAFAGDEVSMGAGACASSSGACASPPLSSPALHSAATLFSAQFFCSGRAEAAEAAQLNG